MRLTCILGRKTCPYWLETDKGSLLPIHDDVYPEMKWAWWLLQNEGSYYSIYNYLGFS